MTTAIETAEIEISENNKFQVMPPLTKHEFAALKADIQARGLQIPVEVDEDGNVLDGHHRARACTELGIDWRSTWKVREGLTEAQKRTHALTLNVKRRHLTGKQKRQLVKQLLLDAFNQSDLWIAREVGVSDKTVRSVRKEMEARSEIPNAETRTDEAGRQQPASKPKAERKPKSAASAPTAALADPAPAAAPPDPVPAVTPVDPQFQEVVGSDEPSTIEQVAPVGAQPEPEPEPEPIDHRGGGTTPAPDLGHRFLAAAQSYAKVLQEISETPEDADPLSGLNDEEMALARAAYSQIKKLGGELSLAF